MGPDRRRCLGSAVEPSGPSADDGSAAVDFALVGGLVTLLFLSVLQLGLIVHVRTTLVDCASEGARYGARADRTPAEGAARTRELIASELSPGYARRVPQIQAGEVGLDGARVVEVRMTAPLPVLGLVGPGAAVPGGVLTVSGHAFAERQ